MKMRGMTLVEVLVTLIIGGIMAFSVGLIIVSTFSSWGRAFQKATLQDDVRYFERRLGKQFRSALYEAAVIKNNGVGNPMPSGNYLQFVSYVEDGNMSNQFVRYTYRVQNGALVCDVISMARDGSGVLQTNGIEANQTVMDQVYAAKFSWVNWPSSNTVSTVLSQQSTLAGGQSYLKISSFTVLSRNRS